MLHILNSDPISALLPLEEGEIDRVAITKISHHEAAKLVAQTAIHSHIGYESTARALSVLLGFPIACHRDAFSWVNIDDQCLVCRVASGVRLENREYALDELMEMQFTFFLLWRTNTITDSLHVSSSRIHLDIPVKGVLS